MASASGNHLPETRKIAIALNVVGLMNVQFAVRGSAVFVIEVNPRASRTIPFISKAIGVPIGSEYLSMTPYLVTIVVLVVISADAARVISIPDFSRGPLQDVAVPATAAGIPLTLSDGGGVENADFTLHYDPAVLEKKLQNLLELSGKLP